MRSDTLKLIPELQEGDNTVEKLVEYRKVADQIAVVEQSRAIAEGQLKLVSPQIDILVERAKAKGYTVDQIDKLTDAEVDELYADTENGEKVEFNVPTDSPRKLNDMRRDFITMLYNNHEQQIKIDASIEEMKSFQDEFQEDVAKLFDEYNGDINDYARKQLNERLASVDENSDAAKGIRAVLSAMDDAIDLVSVKELYSTLDTRNTVSDFFHRSEVYSDKFMTNTKNNGVAVDFSKFDSIEARFLAPKYHTYRNLFLFTIVKMYAGRKTFKRADAIFLTQLLVNIQSLLFEPARNLKTLTEAQEAKRARLIAGIESVLDLFIKE